MKRGLTGRYETTAADLTLSAMSEPRRIITIGDCAQNGGILHESYALTHRPADIEQAIIAHVPGCPPTPAEILCALAELDW